jgi:hypothetical protein
MPINCPDRNDLDANNQWTLTICYARNARPVWRHRFVTSFCKKAKKNYYFCFIHAEKSFYCVIPKKITNILWRRIMSQEVDIWGDSKFNEKICTFILIYKCVMKINISLREKLLYIFDQHYMNMILNLWTFNEIDIMYRIRVADKFINTRVFGQERSKGWIKTKKIPNLHATRICLWGFFCSNNRRSGWGATRRVTRVVGEKKIWPNDIFAREKVNSKLTRRLHHILKQVFAGERYLLLLLAGHWNHRIA